VAKAKKVVEKLPTYIPPPDNYYWFYLGVGYYRKMQPTPYIKQKIDLTNIKKLKNEKEGN